jgi:hypothetical protein
MAYQIKKAKVKGKVPFQKFTQKFYKKLKIGNKEYYLFKVNESIEGKKPKLAWIDAYKEKDRTGFLVESGAGITQEKMEKQIEDYLKRAYGWGY